MRPSAFHNGETQSVERTFDAARVNAIINAPEVRPFVGGEGVLDVSPLIARAENIALMGDHGGFLLTWSAPGSYEVHTFVTNGGRGAWARRAAADTIAFATALGATQLWTRVPVEQTNVAAFAIEMGMRPTSETRDGYDIMAMPLCR